MRTLINIKALDDFRLECTFNDGSKRIADIKPFLDKEVFKPIANQYVFSSALYNGGYFVEWKNHEADLSADTLWHISIPVSDAVIL